MWLGHRNIFEEVVTMDRLTTEQLYAELGFLGNCDEGLTIDYVKTEIVDKADKGDSTAIYKLNQIARHSKQEDIVAYVRGQLARLEGAADVAEKTSEDDEEARG